MTAAQQAAALTMAARRAIKANAVKMTVQLGAQTIVPANTPVLNIQPRNVGLLLGFWVKVTHNISTGRAVQIDLTDFGPENALNQRHFIDLNNTTRHQSAGWHFGMINSVRARRPFGAAIIHSTGYDKPSNYGSNLTVDSAPATIAASTNGVVTKWYWVPVAYSDEDLRGCVYANVTGATMSLLLTMPSQTNICVANGTDSTLAMYVGHAAGAVTAVSITSTTVQTYQVFYDQLPTVQGRPLLPINDLATIYELKYTNVNGMVANQDFGYQYANLRDIYSSVAVYVNNGTTGARGTGADINYFALQAANATNIWKKEPSLIALETRNFLNADLPPGAYYFGTRQRPISTSQYGNMQLLLNPITATANPYMLVGIEDFAVVSSLSNAGSLPSA
jgi:hypothetical protein